MTILIKKRADLVIWTLLLDKLFHSCSPAWKPFALPSQLSSQLESPNGAGQRKASLHCYCLDETNAWCLQAELWSNQTNLSSFSFWSWSSCRSLKKSKEERYFLCQERGKREPWWGWIGEQTWWIERLFVGWIWEGSGSFQFSCMACFDLKLWIWRLVNWKLINLKFGYKWKQIGRRENEEPFFRN